MDIEEDNSKDESKEWRLLLSLKDLGLSLNDCVTMLCRVKKVKFKVITDYAGYSRNALYHSLREHRIPKKPLYESVVKHLNVDPWAVFEIKQASGVEGNITNSHTSGKIIKTGSANHGSTHTRHN